LGDKDEASLKGYGGKKFFGAKLSPFPNRIKGGEYDFEGKRYYVKKNEKDINALHGFLWNKEFIVTDKEAGEEHAALTLGYKYKGDEPGYPFSYDISIIYILDAGGFTCITKIINTSNKSMPLGDGWHPYIKTGTKIDLMKLKLPVSRMIMTNKNLIPDGSAESRKEYLQAHTIGSDWFDNCFGPVEKEGICNTLLIDGQQNVTVNLWQKAGRNGYNYLQLYTPEDRASIVIEPMTCAPDAFNSGEGLIVLEPREETILEFGIKLE
jgi:aldose 1-epimerase